MKLKKEQILNYKCDSCHSFRTHKDMFDENICYGCYDKREENLSTSQSEGTELPFKVPSQSSDKPCPNGCSYSRSMNQKYPRKCMVCGTVEKETKGEWMAEDTY